MPRTTAFPPPPACVWAYPLVGALVGAIGAGCLVGLRDAGMAPLPAALAAIAAMAAVTGGLHEDGLADTFDALGGGRDRAGRLAILQDSRIGAHGALALMLVIGFRAGLLAALPPGRAAWALVWAGLLGRWAMLMVLRAVRPARAGGLGASVSGRPRVVRAGLAIGGVALVAVPWAALAAGVAGLAVAGLAARRFGGHTGDLLGAAAMLAECAALAAS